MKAEGRKGNETLQLLPHKKVFCERALFQRALHSPKRKTNVDFLPTFLVKLELFSFKMTKKTKERKVYR